MSSYIHCEVKFNMIGVLLNFKFIKLFYFLYQKSSFLVILTKLLITYLLLIIYPHACMYFKIIYQNYNHQ